jgi:putative intracellular protease/amidase
MALDWVGPLDILNTLSKDETKPSAIPSVQCTLVGDEIEIIPQSNGMKVTPEITFDQALKEEWDAVLVPGGQGARPWFETNAKCRDFLVEIVPKCRYVFTGDSISTHISVYLDY